MENMAGNESLFHESTLKCLTISPKLLRVIGNLKESEISNIFVGVKERKDDKL